MVPTPKVKETYKSLELTFVEHFSRLVSASNSIVCEVNMYPKFAHKH